MRETTEMWIQEREADTERGNEKGGREEHVECLEDFFVHFARLWFCWELPGFLYEKQPLNIFA